MSIQKSTELKIFNIIKNNVDVPPHLKCVIKKNLLWLVPAPLRVQGFVFVFCTETLED